MHLLYLASEMARRRDPTPHATLVQFKHTHMYIPDLRLHLPTQTPPERVMKH
jgi:hypothetical protein